jgi:hypothetical protein
MADYMTLLGAEDVKSASRQMQSAADDMNRAASSIDASVTRLDQILSEAIARFDTARLFNQPTPAASENDEGRMDNDE